MKIEQKQILKNAISHFGKEAQLNKVMEECIELAKAVNDFRKYPNQQILKDVIDEIVDVEIMIEQLKFIIVKRTQINQRKEFKINRLENIIKFQKIGN